jgi:hypothetical protein
MRTEEYAEKVVEEVVKRTSGRFWCGEYAERTKAVFEPRVPQDVLVSGDGF